MPVWLTYSLLIACAAVFIAGLWLGQRNERAEGGKRAEDGTRAEGGKRGALVARLSRQAGWIQVVAVVLAYLVVRPGAGDDGVGDLARASAAGQPTFIDLYSNF